MLVFCVHGECALGCRGNVLEKMVVNEQGKNGLGGKKKKKGECFDRGRGWADLPLK